MLRSAISLLLLCACIGCVNDGPSPARRATTIVAAYFELCPFRNDHDDGDRAFRDAATQALRSGRLVLDQPAHEGVVANRYQGSWRGEPIVVTYTANPSMVMCGVRFKPAPLLTQAISTQLGHPPATDSGDGLVEWRVSDDPLASLHYENIERRGIPYRGAIAGDSIGYSDNILYTRIRSAGGPTSDQ